MMTKQHLKIAGIIIIVIILLVAGIVGFINYNSNSSIESGSFMEEDNSINASNPENIEFLLDGKSDKAKETSLVESQNTESSVKVLSSEEKNYDYDVVVEKGSDAVIQSPDWEKEKEKAQSEAIEQLEKEKEKAQSDAVK